MPELYPFQQNTVDKIVSLPFPRAFWVLDETGLGKSVTAIATAKALGAKSVLIITLGMIRPAWIARFREWWPEAQVGSITMGRDRKGLSLPAKARLEAAYSAPIQVVSYDLMFHVKQSGWDMIVLDEMDELVSYRSQASKRIRGLFAANSQATWLGLTATLLSAEPKNTWNLLHMFDPGNWGAPLATGDPPWWFQRRYCVRIENEYGVAYRGLREANSEAFRDELAKRSTRTLRSDVRDLLPPIDCTPLLVEADNKKPDEQIAVEWCDVASRESSHVAIFTYHRCSARHICELLKMLPRYRSHTILCATGDDTPEQRHQMLTQALDAPAAVFVGTMDALGKGISLTAFKQYLIAETTTTASKLVQALGRYSRLDSKDACRGQVLLREGIDDDKIVTLRRRLGEFKLLIRAGDGEQALAAALDLPMDGNAFDRRLDALVSTFRGSVDADEDEECFT